VTFNLLYGKDHADSFLLLESGRADAFAMDDNTLAGNISNSKNPQDYRIVGKPLGIEPLSIMLRKDDPRFKAAVDDVIKKMMRSGELEQLYTKWFLRPIPPRGAVINIPIGDALRAAFKSPNDDPAEAYENR
jgi:glutamate/aspartate transport system substrate-binding protein